MARSFKVGELHFASAVSGESDYPTGLRGTRRIDGTRTDPKLSDDRRKEEIECRRKRGLFEVVDERECCDNRCKFSHYEVGGQNTR